MQTYNGHDFFYGVFASATVIVARNRPWFRREMLQAHVHPAVYEAIKLCRPQDWHQLLLEWPHASDADPGLIAYTQNEAKGEADVQTKTRIGRYLTRHFPALADHDVRDLVAKHSTVAQMFFVNTIEDINYHLMRGPASCMNNSTWRSDDGENYYTAQRHPYAAYAPMYGWHMAVRVEEGRTVGRCLCMDEDGEKFFVRSYKRGDGYSYADEALEAWLKDQGYEKRDNWEGCKLAKVRPLSSDCEFAAPYIDGDVKTVSLKRDHLIITEGGEYQCDNTDGTYSGAERFECSDCGDSYSDDDDGAYIGHYADRWVCRCCLDDSYVIAYGRRGSDYYVHAENTVEVDGDYYDVDYLHDNDIVTLENGDHAKADDTWCCAESGEYYLNDDVDPVEIDGDYYHPDSDAAVEYAAKQDSEQTEE